MSGAMARVGDDRQVAHALDQRNGAQVERVARGGLEGADAALAQDDVRIALVHDVLGRHQPLFDGRRQAALEHGRQLRAPDLLEQREVLHVARADLQDVRALGHALDLPWLHHLGDDRQACLASTLLEHLQAFNAESLERIRRGARLEGAAPEKTRARRGDAVRRRQQLLPTLDRARPGHDHEFGAADRHTARR